MDGPTIPSVLTLILVFRCAVVCSFFFHVEGVICIGYGITGYRLRLLKGIYFHKARWPSGLRRQIKDQDIECPLNSGPKGRGFESHSRHSFAAVAKCVVALCQPDGASIDDEYVCQAILADVSFCDQASRYTSKANFYLTITIEEYGSMRQAIDTTKRTMGFMVTLGKLTHGRSTPFVGGEIVIETPFMKVGVPRVWA